MATPVQNAPSTVTTDWVLENLAAAVYDSKNRIYYLFSEAVEDSKGYYVKRPKGGPTGEPIEIEERWGKLPEQWKGITAAVYRPGTGDGVYYFFNGDEYAKRDQGTGQTFGEAKKVSEGWYLPENTYVDAVVYKATTKRYFLYTDHFYWSKDQGIEAVKGPYLIGCGWPNFERLFSGEVGVDAAVWVYEDAWVHEDPHYYFFKGDRYARYDTNSGGFDLDKYPKDTEGNWGTDLPRGLEMPAVHRKSGGASSPRIIPGRVLTPPKEVRHRIRREICVGLR
ncbi:MAG: hypothetical protein GY835_11305 [bacterium]|nr:hypothetical protein [bacterium]